MRVGGIIEFKADGELFSVKGNWTINPGRPKNEAVVGSDEVHGYKSTPQAPYFEGGITDLDGLNIDALYALDDSTMTLRMANGKTAVLRSGWWAGDGDITTEEGEIAARFEGLSMEIINA